MTRKFIIVMLSLCFVLSTMGTGFADGDKRKGKYAYRNLFKACFEAGAVDSAKPTVNPDAKTKAQWKRVFDNKDFTDIGCADEWAKRSEEELADIHAYLREGAADSETPAKCK